MKTYLCIDAGTTHLKLALKEESGTMLSLWSCRLKSTVTEDGRSEMDMEALWLEVRRGVEFLAADEAGARALGNLAGVGVCAQGDGLWLLDGAGKPVRPAILWNDTRAKEIMERIEQEAKLICAETRSVAQFAGSNAVLLRWLAENEPASLWKAVHALHCKDWLNYKMTGRIVTDPTDAGTSLLSRTSEKYDIRMLELLGIPEARSLLPEIVPSRSVVGGVLDGVLPGVPAGTPVIAGSLDVAAAAEGLGIRDVGQTLCILGTTFCVLQMISDDRTSEWPRIGSILCSLSSGRSLRLLASLNGSAVLDWGRSLFGELEIQQAEDEAASIAPGADGVLFLPFVFGERAPFRDAAASGAFLRVRAHHGRAHMLRALYEGLAMVVRTCIEAMPAPPVCINLTGGVAGSQLFCRILTELLNREVIRRDVKEPGIEGIWSLLTGRSLTSSDTVCFMPVAPLLYEPIFVRFQACLEQREHIGTL